MSKILIVEDDALMVNLYKKVFEREGFEVSLAQRGAEGISKAKEVLPDLVLLDIMMPEMDGFEVLSKLKADDVTKSIKVIVLTNLAGTGDEERALEMGALKYIVKSEHDPDEVVNLAKEVMEINNTFGANNN